MDEKLDPDIACLRSLSDAAKRRMQARRRRFDRRVSQEFVAQLHQQAMMNQAAPSRPAGKAGMQTLGELHGFGQGGVPASGPPSGCPDAPTMPIPRMSDA